MTPHRINYALSNPDACLIDASDWLQLKQLVKKWAAANAVLKAERLGR